MIVLVPAVRGMLRQRTLDAIRAAAYEPQVRWLSGDYDYGELLAEYWDADGDLAIVEQDVEVNLATLRSFDACPEPWCVAPYLVDTTLADCLGCTRFRQQVRAPILPRRQVFWANVEVTYFTALRAAGYEPHRHAPVTHHHAY